MNRVLVLPGSISVGPNRQRVCFGIEDPFVQVDLVLVGKQKVQVLECLAEEKRLHHVLGSCVQGVLYVSNGGVACIDFRVFFNSLKIWCKMILQNFSVPLFSLPEKSSIPSLDMFYYR